MTTATRQRPGSAGTQQKSMAMPFQVKAVDEAKRTFTGLASTWEEDLGGDVIEPGAFKNTLAEWKRSKKVLPLIDQHNYGSVRMVVGKLLNAKETDEGLDTTFEIIDGPDGEEIMRRVKGGYVDGLSIGYAATRWEIEETDDRWIRHLKEVTLYEVSVVIWPMNEGARIDTSSVKAALTLIKDPKDLRALASHIGSLLRPKSSSAPPADDQTPAADTPDDDEVDEQEEPVPPEASPSPDDEADSQKGNEPESYLYAEALQQRLLRLKVHTAIGNSTKGDV